MARAGYEIGTVTQIDNALSVPAGGSWTTGTSFDLGSATAPQALDVFAEWSITGGATDGYKLEVWVQWSEDGTNWPDANEGDYVGYFEDTTGGASIAKSRRLITPQPKARYGRFCYVNNNSTDSVTVSSWAGYNYVQSS